MTSSIPTVTSAQDLATRLQQYRQGVTMAVELIELNQVDAIAEPAETPKDAKLWAKDTGGNIGRGDGLFFRAQGLRVMPKGGANPLKFAQPILCEAPPAGTVVLVCDRKTGDVLIDMKTEPGSDPARNHTTLAPTLQVSSSRLAHTNKDKSADVAHTLLGVLVGLGLSEQPAIRVQQDGGRFFNKGNENRVMLVTGKDAFKDVQQPSLLWARPEHLDDDANVNELNEFLWQTLALLPRAKRLGSAQANSDVKTAHIWASVKKALHRFAV